MRWTIRIGELGTTDEWNLDKRIISGNTRVVSQLSLINCHTDYGSILDSTNNQDNLQNNQNRFEQQKAESNSNSGVRWGKMQVNCEAQFEIQEFENMCDLLYSFIM